MSHKVTEELNKLTAEEIQVKVEEWRRELFGLRLNAATAHVKDFSQFSKLRKNIARGMSLLKCKVETQQDATTTVNEG
jgi:ribosomal protein L29